MASFARSIYRLLRRQTPSTTLAKIEAIPTRTAQTQAAPPALQSTQPPPSFQHQHQHGHQTSTPPQKPKPKIQDNDIIASHPILHALRQDPNLRETRPHLSMPPAFRPSHFVAGSLSGDGKLTAAPYMFISRHSASRTEKEQEPRQSRAVTVFHTGSHMCGHPGYVHGGFLSVMFDEVFAHCVSQSFRSGTGMTANLNVDFRKPALPGRVYVLQAETVQVEGRKAWVEGTMSMMPVASGSEDLVLVAEARALFVEPRFAESMGPVYRN